MVSSVVHYYQNQQGLEFIYSKDKVVSYPEHNHVSIYTIGFVLEGEVALRKKEGELFYKQGMYFMVPPLEPHSLYSKANCSMITICVSKDFISKNNLQKAKQVFDRTLPELIKMTGLDFSEISTMSFILDDLYGFEKEDENRIEDELIKPIAQYVQDFPENKLGLESISRITHISKFHFIRKFKQEVGLTPHKFQIQNQIRKAQRLLENDCSIAETAVAVGFFDQSHFTKHFKNVVGLTPAEYRDASMQLTMP